jgi:hypothetical protein
MKKVLLVLIVMVLVMVFAAAAMAHPIGIDAMPAQAAKGLETAYFNLGDSLPASHVIEGLIKSSNKDSQPVPG